MRGGWPAPPRPSAWPWWFRSACGGLRSSSDLPRLEIDPRIDPHIGEIGDQTDHEAEQHKNIECAEHHGIVAIEHAFKRQQPEAVEREDGLDQERAGEEGVDERAR